MHILDEIFGHGKDLNILQMGFRAFVMFFVTLVFIRISGMRSFGSKSAFDNIIVLILGATLSRAVVGASPVIPIITAGLVISLCHRIVAKISTKNITIEKLVKGNEFVLYENGKINTENMEKCNISISDLFEGIRYGANIDSLSDATKIYLEKAGHISVVKAKNDSKS